ncbi:outer membrane beta-barrel protein, partial [Fervidibacter sacchari]
WRRQLRGERFLTVRAEWFRDADGFATGLKQTVKEVTFTYELPVVWLRGTFVRLELRHDFSDAAVFSSGREKHQTTFIFGLFQAF